MIKTDICHILIIYTYFKSVGTTITGFDFEFSNASRRLLAAFEPGSNLLNLESGTTTVTHFLIKDDFYLQQKPITDLIKKYNNFPGEYFVNESYFLYDKSNLIKNTYITAINKAFSIYGSFSDFKGKSANEKLTLLDARNFLKFLVEKNLLRNELKFQLTNISGNIPKTKGNKIHHFSIMQLDRKRKLLMQEPTETIIAPAQQNFDVVGLLNPIHIEIEDDRILNALKKYKNVIYKITPLGLLFPASIKNDTKQIFITCRELNDVKQALLNGKIYGLLGNN